MNGPVSTVRIGIAVAAVLGVAAIDVGDLRHGVVGTVAAGLAGLALG